MCFWVESCGVYMSRRNPYLVVFHSARAGSLMRSCTVRRSSLTLMMSLALTLMMRMLRTWTMTPFVLYRFALGGALLIWLYA